jgi:hypothetical protein
MEYGSNNGYETLDNEYKEFTFNHGGLDIDDSEAEFCVKTSKWIFNDMILNSLKKYIKIYLPKYSSAFLNEESKSNEGNFYIGISDNGTVQGIPFQGYIDIKIITAEVDKVIDSYISCDNMKLLKKSISVELINVNYNNQEIPKYMPLYERYLKQKKKIIKKRKEFFKIMHLWNQIHGRYAQKLVDLFNNPQTRIEIRKYILHNDSTNKVINIIDSGYILEVRTHEEINDLKNYPEEPYYWVCKFKDEYLDKIRKERPIPNFKNEVSGNLNPESIIIKTSNMIPWWIQNNDNMKLFVVKINFIKNKDNKNIYYLDNLGRLNKCYRSHYEEYKPYCCPL